MKNHDFTQKKSYFFPILGRGGARCAPSLDPPLHIIDNKNILSISYSDFTNCGYLVDNKNILSISYSDFTNCGYLVDNKNILSISYSDFTNCGYLVDNKNILSISYSDFTNCGYLVCALCFSAPTDF